MYGKHVEAHLDTSPSNFYEITRIWLLTEFSNIFPLKTKHLTEIPRHSIAM